MLNSIGLAGRFESIVSGDAVANGKPAPDVFLRAAQRLNVPPSACLALEDAPNGIAAAKAAGMACIAVPNEFTRALFVSAADRILPSLVAVRDNFDHLID